MASPRQRALTRAGRADSAAGMKPMALSMLTVCGLEELSLHGSRRVTHVLSILDPEMAEPEAFAAYDRHHRTTLRFHDGLEAGPGQMRPEPAHVEAILAFGAAMAAGGESEVHLLVHCHAGISRSTAAMATLMAQYAPARNEAEIFESLVAMRPRAWPNSRMIGFADDLLGRNGRLTAALPALYRRQLAAYPHVRDFMRDNGENLMSRSASACARVLPRKYPKSR